MNITTLIRDISFWDEFAPWYEKWLTRGNYHQSIIREISQMVEPGWRVLDIGAATGVLSIPMASLGCSVDALEPSEGMRKIFNEKLRSLAVKNIRIIDETWEEYETSATLPYNLIIACNSLHLTRGGIKKGMEKVFAHASEYVCLVTEINQSIFIDFKEINALQSEYEFLYIKNYRVNSSFVFEDMKEVLALSELLNTEVQVAEEGGRLIQPDSTDIAVLWWERR